MEFGFLFWFFFVGITIATMQDLKRREVDNWLNLLLFFSGIIYLVFGLILSGNVENIFHVAFIVLIMFVVMNIFYYGRIFAGGDAKLLFAMSVFFVGASFLESVGNVGVFLLFLMVAGSIYGLFYSLVLWFLNRKKVNLEISKTVKGNRWFVFIFALAFVLMVFGVWNFMFFLFGLLLGVFPVLYIFANSLESVLMIRAVRGSELREGDWLVGDVRVGGRVIETCWDGLSLEDIELLKNKKRVLIKEGLPFVPAFLVAFLCYVFLKGWLISIFIG